MLGAFATRRRSGDAVTFAAGLLLARTPQAREVEHGVASIGHFFVPLFFVVVGAAVDIQGLNPLNSDNYRTLLVGSVLIMVAVGSKCAAGFAALWFTLIMMATTFVAPPRLRLLLPPTLEQLRATESEGIDDLVTVSK